MRPAREEQRPGATERQRSASEHIVCHNEEQAAKDQHDREAILTKLENQLRQGAKSLIGNKGYRKYLRQTTRGAFAIDQQRVKDEARFDGKWVLRTDTDLPAEDAAETNYSAISTHMEIFYAITTRKQGASSGVMHDEGGHPIRHITDGTSHTFLVGEADHAEDDPFKQELEYGDCPRGICSLGKLWASENRIMTAYGINNEPNLYLRPGVFSHHLGGAQFLYADGHVKFLEESMDQRVLEALTTRAGGEIENAYDFLTNASGCRALQFTSVAESPNPTAHPIGG